MATKIFLSSFVIFILAFFVVIGSAQTEADTLITELSGGESGDVRIMGFDLTNFPKISISIFVDTNCARNGGLISGDFNLVEDGSEVAIENFVFTGQGGDQSLDLAVVFDDSSSMSPYIDAMKSEVQGLIDQIAGSGLDARYMLVSFKDDENLRSSWTRGSSSFKAEVNSLYATGGGDTPEDALDAIEATLASSFRPEAQKVILVITDAPAHQSGDGTPYTVRTGSEVKADILRSGAVLIVVSPVISWDVGQNLDLKDLANEVGGTWIDINSADFSHILGDITKMITGMYVIEYTSPDRSGNASRVVQVSVSNTTCGSGQDTSTYTLPGSPIPERATKTPTTANPRFSYAGDGNGGQVMNTFASDETNDYKVTLDKKLETPEYGGCQDIVISITPDNIPTKDYVIFAIDHSGSTYQGGYAQAIVDGIGDTLASTSGVRYQRVDWNDQIVYSSTLFQDSRHWTTERSRPPVGTDYPLDGSGPRSSEEQPTWYSVGLKGAVDRIIAEKNLPDTTVLARKTTGWKVIFITGKSEFSRGDLDDYYRAIDDAKKEGVDIYTIGIGISKNDGTTENEQYALKEEIASKNTSEFVYLQETDPSDVEGFVRRSVSNILYGSGGYYTGPVAKDVIITESIYPYLSVVGSSIQPISQNANPDGSTTMTFNLGDLKGRETKTVKIYTALDLYKLPIDISKEKTRVDFTPDITTPPSIVKYRSLIDEPGDEPRKIDMPEGELSIFCSPAVAATKSVTPTMPEASTPAEEPSTPGFEAAYGVFGLLAAAYQLRRW